MSRFVVASPYSYGRLRHGLAEFVLHVPLKSISFYRYSEPLFLAVYLTRYTFMYFQTTTFMKVCYFDEGLYKDNSFCVYYMCIKVFIFILNNLFVVVKYVINTLI
jgi:hypothetical protein